MRTSEQRVPTTSFIGLPWAFPLRIATALAGVLGRVLLVLGASARGLLLLNALVSALDWVLMHDQRALADAASFLAEAAVLFIVTATGAYGRERLRRTLDTRRKRKLVAVSPWS